MRQLALDFLREQLEADDDSDPWEWYLESRKQRPELSRYFLEPARESIAPLHPSGVGDDRNGC
jgi:hypothetical protein